MIKMGIIGLGHWGPNYVRNFSTLKNCCVKTVCDLSEERLMYIKSLYPQVQVTRDYEEILKDVEIDAVVIATPATMHYRFTKEALVSGKHVLVEKPFVLNVKKGEELIGIAEKLNKTLMVAHTFLYNSGIRSLKQYIENGTLGRIYYLHSTRTNLGPIREDVSAMWDLAPHDISIFSYLLDAEPVQVTAKGETYLQQDGTDDVTFITLTYPGKVIANIHVSWLDPRKVREITVIGNRKMALFNDLDGSRPIKIFDKKVMRKKYRHDYDSFREFKMIIKEGKEITPRIKMEEPLKSQCLHFLECIEVGAGPISDGRNGLNVSSVLIAIQKSLKKNGRPVVI